MNYPQVCILLILVLLGIIVASILYYYLENRLDNKNDISPDNENIKKEKEKK